MNNEFSELLELFRSVGIAPKSITHSLSDISIEIKQPEVQLSYVNNEISFLRGTLTQKCLNNIELAQRLPNDLYTIKISHEIKSQQDLIEFLKFIQGTVAGLQTKNDLLAFYRNQLDEIQRMIIRLEETRELWSQQHCKVIICRDYNKKDDKHPMAIYINGKFFKQNVDNGRTTAFDVPISLGYLKIEVGGDPIRERAAVESSNIAGEVVKVGCFVEKNGLVKLWLE